MKNIVKTIIPVVSFLFGMGFLASSASAQHPAPNHQACMTAHGIDCHKKGCEHLCKPGNPGAHKDDHHVPAKPGPGHVVGPNGSKHPHASGPAPMPPKPQLPGPANKPDPHAKPSAVEIPIPVKKPAPLPPQKVVPPGVQARIRELQMENDRLRIKREKAVRDADAAYSQCIYLPKPVRSRCTRPEGKIRDIDRRIDKNNKEIQRLML